MSGRVLVTLTAADTWYGREIRKAIKSNVNHSLVLYESSDWQDWRAVDTQEHGVQPAVSAKRLTRVDYAECWESDLDLWKGLRGVKKDFYKKYDWIGLGFGLVRALLANYLGIKIEKPIHAHNRLFCSEYVAAVLQASHIPGTENWVPANISPADLRRLMMNSSHFREVKPPPPILQKVSLTQLANS